MELHAGAPFWLIRNGLAAPGTPLDREERCDVAIIGAGITGALIADALTAEGLDVVLIDRRAPGLGSTSASTALLLYELDVELIALTEKIGAHAAVRAYRMCYDAIARLEQLVTELGGVSFSRRPSLYLASRRRDAKRLTTEVALRQAAGLPAEWWGRKRVRDRYGFPSHGAIAVPDAGEVDALQLTRRLLERAIARGARCYERTAMRGYEEHGDGLRVLTDRSHTISARRIVFATGYEVPSNSVEGLVTLHSSYALATEVVDDAGAWDDRCLVWESARPYSYMRGAPDGRIIIGGEDLPFKNAGLRDRLLPARQRRLERRLARLLPDVEAPTAFAWGGTFGETSDGLPYIGPDPHLPGVLLALGYGGNGVTFGVIAAELIAAYCAGRQHPDAPLYALGRSPSA